MSMSEYAQLMKEAGMISSTANGNGKAMIGGGDNSNKIQVEHIFIMDVSEKWEKICKGAILGFLNLGRHVVDSLRIVAIAGSIAVVLWGGSRLITSIRSGKVHDSELQNLS